MSGLVKMIRVQLGLSPTPSNNFTLRNLIDGTLRLSRGNSGAEIVDVLRVEADNSIALSASPAVGNSSLKIATTAFVAGAALGIGQTWQNMIGSRALATPVVNTTGRSIMVSVVAGGTTTGAAASISAVVDGVTIATVITNESSGAAYQQKTTQVAFVVPPGATYSVINTVNVSVITVWAELR